jgi:hypothetical protein
MPFVKGDPNINRSGRPKNAEPDLLREALRKEGAKRGIDFWDKVAQFAFTDRNMTIAVLKKFIPDMTHQEIEGSLNVTQMPMVRLDDVPQEIDIGVENASS